MIDVRTLVKRALRDWPSWAQVLGVLIGLEQLVSWGVGGEQPNLGAMTFAGALLMFQRAASAQQSRSEKRR
jgi:hypothetical protein